MSVVKTIKNLREDNQYQDITTDGLEGISIEKLDRVPSRKFIKMDVAFEDLSAEDRAVYWHSLASSLNQALDTMQAERNQVLESCVRQEKQIVALQNQIAGHATALTAHINSLNNSQNKRAEELHEAKQKHGKMVRKLKREKAELEARLAELKG